MRKQKKVTRGLRYDAELNNRIEAATKQADSHAAARSYAPRSSGSWQAAKAASMWRAENRRESLAKTFLTGVPSGQGCATDQAVARAKRATADFKSVGIGMGDSRRHEQSC